MFTVDDRDFFHRYMPKDPKMVKKKIFFSLKMFRFKKMSMYGFMQLLAMKGFSIKCYYSIYNGFYARMFNWCMECSYSLYCFMNGSLCIVTLYGFYANPFNWESIFILMVMIFEIKYYGLFFLYQLLYIFWWVSYVLVWY